MVDARVFQAMSDGTRLRILSLLAAAPTNVSRIVAHLKCAQPAVSRHLRVLRDAALIRGTRKGKEVTYSLNAEALRAAVGYLNDLTGGPGQAASRARTTEAAAPSEPQWQVARSRGRGPGAGRKGGGGGGGAGQRRQAAAGPKAGEGTREAGQGAHDFASREDNFAVERKPSGLDDFLL
jgi:DNA-binding transcriptional ArsR family regulator